MCPKQYTKHAILHGFYIEKPCNNAKVQIENWFKRRDYRSLERLNTLGYAQEIKMRLHILQSLTANLFYVSPASNDVMNSWKFSCLQEAPCMSTSHSVQNTSQGVRVYIEEPDQLPQRHALAKMYKEKLPVLPESASPEDIEHHARETQIAFNRQKYLCPHHQGGDQFLLSVNLSGGSDKELMKEISNLIRWLREHTAIPESPKSKNQRDKKSINSFMKHNVLLYLDLLIYRICPQKNTTDKNQPFLRPQPGYIWDLTDKEVIELLSIDATSEEFKKQRRTLYDNQIFNTTYMRRCLLSIEAEHSH